MYIGTSISCDLASAIASFNKARSLEPGAYEYTGSFTGAGTLKNPFNMIIIIYCKNIKFCLIYIHPIYPSVNIFYQNKRYTVDFYQPTTNLSYISRLCACLYLFCDSSLMTLFMCLIL